MRQIEQPTKYKSCFSMFLDLLITNLSNEMSKKQTKNTGDIIKNNTKGRITI